MLSWPLSKYVHIIVVWLNLGQFPSSFGTNIKLKSRRKGTSPLPCVTTLIAYAWSGGGGDIHPLQSVNKIPCKNIWLNFDLKSRVLQECPQPRKGPAEKWAAIFEQKTSTYCKHLSNHFHEMLKLCRRPIQHNAKMFGKILIMITMKLVVSSERSLSMISRERLKNTNMILKHSSLFRT